MSIPPRQISHICRRQMSIPPRHLWRGGGRQAGGKVSLHSPSLLLGCGFAFGDTSNLIQRKYLTVTAGLTTITNDARCSALWTCRDYIRTTHYCIIIAAAITIARNILIFTNTQPFITILQIAFVFLWTLKCLVYAIIGLAIGLLFDKHHMANVIRIFGVISYLETSIVFGE